VGRHDDSAIDIHAAPSSAGSGSTVRQDGVQQKSARETWKGILMERVLCYVAGFFVFKTRDSLVLRDCTPLLFCHSATGVLITVFSNPYQPVQWHLADMGCYLVTTYKQEKGL